MKTYTTHIWIKTLLALIIGMIISGCEGAGSGTDSDDGNTAANHTPIANATANPTAVNQGNPVTFDGSGSTDSDGSITSYVWKERSTLLHYGVSFTRNDLTVGTHTITLTVTDDDNATDTDEVDVTVTTNISSDTTPPIITINGDNPENVVQFSNYTDAGATANDDVDGAVAVSTAGIVDTDTVGGYLITYTAADSAGNSATTKRTVNVTTFSITHNGTTYGAVKSPYTGKVWLDRNLGATQVCRDFNDTACYGDYYQWGRNADGHEKSNSNTTATQATNVTNVGHGDFITSDSDHDYDWAQAADSNGSQRSKNWSKTDGTSICPSGFRVPTIDEFSAELFDSGSAEISNNWSAFYNFLGLPSADRRDETGSSPDLDGNFGLLWSSSLHGSDSIYVGFDSIMAIGSYENRAHGMSVRCLKD